MSTTLPDCTDRTVIERARARYTPEDWRLIMLLIGVQCGEVGILTALRKIREMTA